MAVLSWVIICERAIVEQGTNNLSLMSLVEEVRLAPPPSDLKIDLKNPPVIPHRFSVVQRWTRSKKDKPEIVIVRSRLLRSDGKEYANFVQELRLDKFLNAQFVAQSVGFPYVGPGEYLVQIQIKSGEKWRTVGTVGFNVVLDESLARDSGIRH